MNYQGLNSEQVRSGLEKWGRNEILIAKERPWWLMIFGQVNNALVYLMLGASVMSFAIGDLFEAILILIIVVLNTVLGFVQEFKAEQALEKLKLLTVTKCRVIRNNIEQEIDSREITVGDVVIVEEGTKITADGVLLEAVELEVNESVLTGGSMPIIKDEQLDGDEKKVFGGTIVTKGRGIYRVTNVGMNMKFGKIAKNLSEIKEEKSPLQKKMAILTKRIMLLGIVVSIVLGVNEGILAGISLAVAVIPEGLPAVMIITLSLGAAKMAKNKAVVKKMTAIEALGAVNLIATDKTGTITKNQMEVVETYFDGNEKQALLVSALCNTSALVLRKNESEMEVIGDQTEGALMKWAYVKGIDVNEIKNKFEKKGEWLFDSTARMMSMSVVSPENKEWILAKGSVDKILEKCTHLSKKELTEILKRHDQMAKQGLRILALAGREFRGEKNRDEVERDLHWYGMAGIADPIREETTEVIKNAQAAGIKVIMITGDNELTAKAIAVQAGILLKDEDILSGVQVDQLTDLELTAHLSHVRVFSRMRPEQKLRLVKLLQDIGMVTAMTGDGVNDAPALKQADVGVAMGKNGTDVAREAADIVLLDDNLKTLVVAVESGRTIVDNLLKIIKYLLTSNLGEVLVILGGTVGFGILPLSPIQILWTNLVTDGLPALAIAVSNGGAVMKPRPNDFLGIKDWIGMIMGAVIITAFSLGAYMIWGKIGVFNMLVLGQLILALLINGRRLNWGLILIVLFTAGLQGLMYTIPIFRAALY